MKTVIVIAVLFGLVCMAAQGAHAVEIVVPDANVSTARSRITLVGRAASPAVTVEIKDQEDTTVPVTDGWFHVRVFLPYGLNEVSVHAAGGAADSALVDADGDGAPSSASVQVLCSPRVTRNQQKIFLPYAFHEETSGESCLPCHRPLEAGGDDSDWCLTCHAVVKEKFRRHVPDDRRSCTNCHLMGEGLSGITTGTYTDMNPCFLCHKDKIGEFSQDYIHGPVAGGTCTVCHDPHGSEFDKTLRSPEPVLCLFCHTAVTDENAPVQHQPFLLGRCVTCHDPHATANKWVLVKSSRSLCLSCHGKDGRLEHHNHPYDVKPRHRLERSLRLADNGELECLTCHRAHGSQSKALLRSESANVCLDCHPEHG